MCSVQTRGDKKRAAEQAAEEEERARKEQRRVVECVICFNDSTEVAMRDGGGSGCSNCKWWGATRRRPRRGAALHSCMGGL